MNKYESFYLSFLESFKDSLDNFNNQLKKMDFNNEFIDGYLLSTEVVFDILSQSADAYGISFDANELKESISLLSKNRK